MKGSIRANPVVLTLTALVIALLIAVPLAVSFARVPTAHASGGITTKSAFCQNLGRTYQASSGAQMFCLGPRHTSAKSLVGASGSPGTNVNAANPREDVSPAGVQAYGQSETSIAAVGPYVVEAWNDATAFVSPCPSPMSKEEGTGFGFSANGGSAFADQGGLPNATCSAALYGGDPSVEAWRPGGTAYFYISSLFNPTFSFSGPPPSDVRSHIAMAACKATGSGSSALISCSQPILISSSSICMTQSGSSFCGFLDKDFLSIDPARGRLYASYTEFFFNPTTGVQTSTVELAVCDIGTPTGGTGSAGGTAGAPVCFNGARGSQTSPAPPYLVVAPPDVHGCENEGAYPAVDVKTGDVYVAYEHNWATSFQLAVCSTSSEAIQEVMNFVPFSACLTLTPTSSCVAKNLNSSAVSVNSMELAMIPGYNRFPMNDFPRLAVSDQAGAVSMVWNDTRVHAAGDILLQSFHLVTLVGVQAAPVRLSTESAGWHFLPALRNSDQNGNITVSWYSRSSANTAITNVYAALRINPRLSSRSGSNALVTSRPSDWNAVSSDIVPNFGDYTDNYVIATPNGPVYTALRLYMAWSDGRLGDPQPFEAHT